MSVRVSVIGNCTSQSFATFPLPTFSLRDALPFFPHLIPPICLHVLFPWTNVFLNLIPVHFHCFPGSSPTLPIWSVFSCPIWFPAYLCPIHGHLHSFCSPQVQLSAGSNNRSLDDRKKIFVGILLCWCALDAPPLTSIDIHWPYLTSAACEVRSRAIDTELSLWHALTIFDHVKA